MNNLNLRRISFFLVLILVTGGSVFAQGFNNTNWKFSNPKQFGFTVLDVDYFDNNNAIAVGSNGGIAKTTDGGRNWTYGVYTYINPTGFKVTANFNDVHYITSTVAYAVASNGAMVKTTDGGTTWNFVNTPLLPNLKNINACWFLDANKGYIGGQVNNTADSLPKLYVTLNGGATWDSIAAPAVNGVTRVGYINNPLIPSVLYPVDAKMKEIFRIEFTSANTGYISGSNSYGVTLFPNVSFRATSAAVCTPLATFLTSGSMGAALLWKFNNGVLTDYSISKERLGYFGINLAPASITCTSAFASITPVTQQYRAMNIYNDSTVVLMSFNNNTVVKVRTGVNDSTENPNAPGIFEKGKFEVLNFPFPPTAGPNAGPPIPNPQVLLASNPYQMKKTANGTLIVNGNFGRMHKSIDTGRNWIADVTLPQGQNYSALGVWGMDIAPNGRVLSLGTNGVMADSLPGSSWQSNYITTPLSAGYNDMEFIDCNNGMAVGGAGITVTNDGGNTWIDRASPVLAALFANITHLSFVNPTKVYFTTSIGNIYRSANQGVNLSPVFAEPLGGQVNDIAWQGNDSLWAVGYSSFSVPAASRQGRVYRSFNNAATWDTIPVGPVGALSFTPRAMDFPTRSIGYICGTRNYVYKTIDAGATWTDISPFPALTPQLTYTAMQALNKDTIFVLGNGFPRKAVYRTTDGGATWTDITGNILTTGVGNLNGILMHDINNGYVMTPGGALLVTTNGGTSWTLDLAPTQNLFTTAAFVPRSVGPGVNMVNRKMLVSGPNISGAPIMEYGNPANTQVNSTELITGAACSSPNSGTITITATGGLAPYTYRLNAGPFQPSNVFTNVPAGIHTITIRDAYCGLLTKTVTVALNDDQILNTNITTATICAGAPVQLIASGNSTTYSWSPALGLSNPNIANPIATPLVTTTYTVTATLNSCVKTRSITITVNPNANLIIVADPGTTICEGDPTLLTVYDAGAVTAPGVLYTQGTTPVNGSPSQVFEPANAAFTSQGADNFTIPAGGLWTVTQITANGIGAGVPTSVNVFFYANSGANLPGAAISSQLNITTFVKVGGNYTVTLPTPLALGAGTYWMSFQVNMSFATGGQWFWGNFGAANINLEYAWQNPGGGFATPCTAWGYGGTGCNVGGGAANRNNIFSIIGTNVGLGPQSTGTFLWSPALGLSSTTSNPVAASPMNTTTYTVVRTTVPGGCQASAQVTITVNKRPVVTTQPANVVRCVGTTATFTVGGTGTGLTYQWQVSTAGCAGPWVNLTNVAPYSGVTTATLTVNPVTQLMSGYAYRCVLGGTCTPFIPPTNVSNCATLSVNPNPVVTITPAGPVCGGVAGISGTQLSTASTPPPVPGSVTVNSGAISIPVPDNNPAGVSSNLTVAGIPANATVTGVRATWTMPHTWNGDMVFVLRSPNGSILNLDYFLSATGGAGATTGFVNTTVSSAGTAAISTGTGTYTGTFRADATMATIPPFGPPGPTGFTPTVATWTPMYTPIPNGTWTLAMYDGGAIDLGTLTNWSVTVDYTTPGTTGSTLSYVWSPVAGLYTDPTAVTPYTGQNLSTVYAAPTVQTLYTVTATDATTGCFSTASVLVNYTPPAPTVTPSSVTMCLGDPAVRLIASSSSTTTTTYTSGTISVPIPEGTFPTGPYVAGTSTIPVAGIPVGAAISRINVRMNITHAFVGDVVAVLQAPNGQRINLDALLNATNNPGANFVNTVISSAGVTALSAGTAPWTNTFRADAVGATFTIFGFPLPGGPVGYIPTTTTWPPLYGTPNGNWTLALYDAGAPDIGTLTNWSMDISYVVGVPSTAATWSPIGGLFNDALATIPYAGTPRDTVWTRPTPSGVYTYTVTVQSLPASNPVPVSFTNPANIIINQAGPATPYPSNLTVSGLATTGISVNSVILTGMSHTWGDDIDILLQSPTGQNVVLMSDVGGTVAVPNATYTFVDGAAAMNPTAPNPTGTYRPTNNGAADNWPAPGPGAITQATPTLSLFGSTADVNGVWKLFVFDDIGGDAGNISGGYTIRFNTPLAPCTSPARTVVVTVNQPTTLNASLPANQTICTDKVATFSVAVTAGTGPHSYQWQVSTTGIAGTYNNVVNGGVYSGATTATLTITAPPVSMSGYFYRCIVTGAAPCAAVTSISAGLTVNPLPVVVINTNRTSLLPGLTATLTSTVAPNPVAPGGYSWIRNGGVLSSSSLGVVSGIGTGSIVVDVDGMGDYQLRVTDVNGCTSISNTITIKDSASGKCFIYPNPTSGKFQVRYYSVANNVLPRTMTVYDSKGDRMITQFYTIGRPYDRMDVDMRAFGKGLYWVEIGDRNGNRLVVCRVVIQ